MKANDLSIRSFGALCLTLLLVACGREQTETPRAARVATTHFDSAAGEVAQYSLMHGSAVWLTDSNVIALATIVNQAPVHLARIESQQSTDQAVHEFALEVLRDHNALQGSLDSLAAKRRIPSQTPAVAASVAAPYDSAIATVSSAPTQQMEQRYLEAERAIDTHALTDFAAVAGNATDPDLRALLAIRAMTMEQHHVARANQLTASLAQADSAKQAARSARKIRP